jgi:hypothetical protein
MERGIQIAKSGILKPAYTPAEEMRKVAEENSEWSYAHEVQRFYDRSKEVMRRFYSDIQGYQELPEVVFGVTSLRNKNTLAAYRLIPDAVGLPFRIDFNEQHYIDGENGKEWRYGEWAKYETLAHELGHHWQQLKGKDPFTRKSKVTHNAEFTGKLASIGLQCDSDGAHFAVASADSPVGILFTEWGLKPPPDVPRGDPNEFDWFKFFADREGRERPGTSTLVKYECPSCGLKVRYGKQDEPFLMHVPCGELLVRK